VKKLFLIYLIFMISCSSEAVEELTEYDKCLQSYQAIQEANLSFNELLSLEQGLFGREDIKIKFNDFEEDVGTIWSVYYIWVNIPENQKESYIEVAKRNSFFDSVTFIDNNIKTEEEFKSLIGLPIAEIKKIIENLDLVEPNVNNFTNYSGYKNLLNNTVEIFELYIANLPEVGVVYDENGEFTDEYGDMFVIEEDYRLDIFNPELVANIYASNVIVELYEKCVDN
jgi:hypothetical protein